MKTIDSGISQIDAVSMLEPACWPDYVEESFDRLVASVTAIAALPIENTASAPNLN